ncbi:MAG: glycerol-3-phosphate dehydrogenase/oxidase [Bacteroidales bacterium]|nr:glycerol-3-phosphate dehydrogenase/oxidase [Bacteroidales bacterium]
MQLNRESILKQLDEPDHEWDILVIGGGATGLGTALEAVTRGYKTILLEQDDFAKGTSSRSTKLIHGGVRYLAQGNISLVMEALRERGRLKRNAPHLVKDQSFVIPCYNWWCVPFYTIGLTLYDLMAGKLGIGRSVPLSKQKTLQSLPSIKSDKLRGGVRYHDCQFDDSRLAINLCQTLLEQGGVAINYMKVTGLIKEEGRIAGAVAEDMETGQGYFLSAKVVINATGVFVDQILKMEDPEAREVVKPSQGIHLVLDERFLKGKEALMIPKTSDGRVLFAVPWHNRVVVGTTDVEKQLAELEPHAEQEEVEYIIETAGRYFDVPPVKSDVLSVFTGLRPLAAPSGTGKKTKEISRGHKILVSDGGLITIIGGKWTTYRKMGEDVIDVAVGKANLPERKSITRDLRIHGYRQGVNLQNPHYWYGSDQDQIESLEEADPALEEVLSEKLNIRKSQIIWAIRGEFARTLEDCLARRTRALQLDARESIRIAPGVAGIMAAELGYDQNWELMQVEAFTKLAENYLLN